MAIVFCRECGKKISDSAESCPSCGAVTKNVSTKKDDLWRRLNHNLFVLFVFGMWMGGMFGFLGLAFCAAMFFWSKKHPLSSTPADKVTSRAVLELVVAMIATVISAIIHNAFTMAAMGL